MIAVAKFGKDVDLLVPIGTNTVSPTEFKALTPIINRNSENVLVARLIAKDMEAFNILYTRYSKAMYGIIYRVIPEEHEANDLLQDSFVKVWQSIGSYNSEKGSFFTWLLNICRNTAIDRRRSKGFRNNQRNQDIDQITNFSGSIFEVNFHTDHIGLKDLTEKLGREYSILIDAVYFQGYTQQEISDQLNIPLGTVKTRIRAALLKLRKLI